MPGGDFKGLEKQVKEVISECANVKRRIFWIAKTDDVKKNSQNNISEERKSCEKEIQEYSALYNKAESYQVKVGGLLKETNQSRAKWENYYNQLEEGKRKVKERLDTERERLRSLS